ncbi:AAA family ATPase [Nesterenkonia sp. E16_7]|uniref:helix-turn-helix transcriptional regulator n=1 Tax=unclassified Nesterenkonia TaxID=2629769 RepID=UPI001A90D907|nr:MULTISPECIES: LuxR family transcriptional regulator [unclassified Nesterenkonia]MBO0596064.1 AAA family ATPase [Nesterenkonia sp. E16_10]MBO0599334.1 AAA family ATPase [Nesterenkonia sp. E16_7]
MSRLHRFLGRESELELIAAAAESVHSSSDPRFILIDGPPGVGKTSLLNEAVARLTGWSRANVYLDVADRATPGYAAAHLLRKPQRYHAPADPQELAALVQEQVDGITEPVVLVIEDLQWMDPLSAAVIYQTIREVEDVPLLSLVTSRPSTRPELQRLARYTATAGEALRIGVEPFSRAEVRALLQEETGLPISSNVTARIHDATGGFPAFLDHVIEKLTARDEAITAAALDEALEQLDRGEGPAESQRQRIRQVFEETPAQLQEVLALLGLSSYPLAIHEIRDLLGIEAVDAAALRDSGLVQESVRSGRFFLTHHIFRQGLVAGLPREQRADLHLRLARLDAGPSSARHRAEAALLDPSVGDRPAIVAALTEAARTASRTSDHAETLELSRLAFEVDRSGDTLEALTFAAMRAGTRFAIDSTISWAQSHENVHPVLRRGILARESLIRGDLQSTLGFLAGGVGLEEASPKALLCYADTVLSASRTTGLRGSYWQLFKVAERTVEVLQLLEARLEAEDPTLHIRMATTEQLLAEARGLRVSLQLWRLLEGMDAAEPELFSQEVEGLLEEVRQIPGTESAQLVLLVARGALLRTTGHLSQAYSDLISAVENWPGRNRRALAHAEIHLTYLLFEAGMWSEAQGFAESAAAEVLDISEDNLAPVAFNAAHLVPAARGEREGQNWPFDLRAHIHRMTDTSLGRAGRGFVEAWGATCAQDHERVISSVLGLQAELNIWSRAITPAVLLGRSLFHSGRAQALPALITKVRADEHSSAAQREYVLRHLRGLAAMGAGKHVTAYEHLSAAMTTISGIPALKSSQVSGDGGALSIYRGLLALDLAQCVVLGMDSLQEKVEQSSEWVLWAGSMFQGCGAEGLFHQADEVFRTLRKGGALPDAVGRARMIDLPAGLSSKARFALAALTAREREIALMVGHGLSNKDVAEELVLSVRTVEYHVANALGKLALDSRHALRRMLQDEAEDGLRTA